MLGYFRQNVRHSVRMLFKKPGFTVMAVLTLALGIGATTAIFSVVYATLFEPIPYPNPDQLVMVWSQVKQGRNSSSVADYLEWKRRSTSFQYLEAWSGATFNVATAERPEQIQAALMTPDFFRMTGIPMMLGRSFLPEEGCVGNDHVVIMSHRIWAQFFGADRDIIGQQIRMNSEPYTVIGVASAGIYDRTPSQLWLPLAFRPEQVSHRSHNVLVMGRLRDNVSVPQANAEMKSIAAKLADELPESNAGWSASVEPLQNNFIPEKTIKNLWLLLGAVGFLLLISCVNIANLLLARGTTRRREVAIRAALGASRTQLFGQFLTESLVLAVMGGALGVYFADLIIAAITAILPFQMLPSEADVRISIPVLLFTMAATMMAGLLFGCAPALQASRLDLNEVLKQGGRTGAGLSGRRLRHALVVVELALALTLLAGGGLALRSFWNLTHIDLGFRTDHILTFTLPVQPGRFKEMQSVGLYYRRMLEKIESVPGIEEATLTTGMPLRGAGFGTAFRIAGAAPEAATNERLASSFQMITPEYFKTFGIRLLSGRQFTEEDNATAPRVVMVNETFAARYLPDVNPLAQRIIVNKIVPTTPQRGPEEEWRIVGVFHNTRGGDGLRGDEFPVIYAPFWQSPCPRVTVAARTPVHPQMVSQSIAAAVNEVDPDLPIAGVQTMDKVLSESLAFDRFGMALYGSFAIVALILAAICIYGVMAFAVAQRTQEFGIRMALGARREQIIGLVLREGSLLAMIGLGIGLVGAYLVGRAMKTTLYGVNALDAVALIGVAIVLMGASLLACYLPARRASRVDPMVALRDE